VKYHQHILIVSRKEEHRLADILTKWCWDVAEDYCAKRGVHYENAGIAFMFNMSFHVYNLLQEAHTKDRVIFTLDESKISMKK